MHSVSTRNFVSSVHFGISIFAFLILLYFVMQHWFPGSHFTVNGGWQGIRIILPVLIILGPCLTFFLVFSPGKSARAIAFDLACIAILQTGAFGYGIYALHTQRPVGMALSGGIIYPVVEEELFLQNKTAVDLESLDEGRPPVVFTRAPVTDDEQVEAVAYDLMQGIPETKLFILFDPINQHIEELFAASLDNVRPAPENFLPVRDNYLDKHGLNNEDLAFLPFEGRYGRTVLVFNRRGNIIDFIPNPR